VRTFYTVSACKLRTAFYAHGITHGSQVAALCSSQSVSELTLGIYLPTPASSWVQVLLSSTFMPETGLLAAYSVFTF